MADNLEPMVRSWGKSGDADQDVGRAAPAAAPAKADAAPKPSTTDQGTGLIAALNAYWETIAKSKGFIPDKYEIKFADPLLMNAKVAPPGPLDKSFAGGPPQQTAADELLPEKQNLSPNVRQRSATAGQQIVQFIDTVLRNSNYITDQQKVIWNSKLNEWEANGKPAQNFAWFNISCQAEQLQYDPKQNDFAYRLTYIIAPYQIPVLSEYFDNTGFRGVHKVYNYWFTGQNTQVLEFEQAYNNAWTQALTSDISVRAGNESTASLVNSREQWKKRYMPASNQARQGGDGKTFEAGANAADYLYTTDTAIINLKILGDPAWIPPPTNIQIGQFTTSAFFPDGSINTGASAPYFEFAWNKSTDYDPNTGLMDTGQNNFGSDRANGSAGIAQQAISYTANTVKSIFRGGRFSQELSGTWLQSPTKKAVAAADSGRKTDPAVPVGPQPTLDDQGRPIFRPRPTLDDQGRPVFRRGAGSNAVRANLEVDQVAALGLTSSSLPANSITSINAAELRPATFPDQEPALQPTVAVAAPPVLPKGGFGSGADNPSVNRNTPVVTASAPQGIVNDDQGWST
jgi:hypothetical protein